VKTRAEANCQWWARERMRGGTVSAVFRAIASCAIRLPCPSWFPAIERAHEKCTQQEREGPITDDHAASGSAEARHAEGQVGVVVFSRRK